MISQKQKVYFFESFGLSLSLAFVLAVRPESTLLEVDRAWARARRPGPKNRLAVNKGKARARPSLFYQGSTKPKHGLEQVKSLFDKFKTGLGAGSTRQMHRLELVQARSPKLGLGSGSKKTGSIHP